MNKFIFLILLSFTALSSSAYVGVSDEINDMISAFDVCDDAQNPEIFVEMFELLQSSDKKGADNPFYVSTSRYVIEFESEDNSCQVFVDPYDARCYTPVCE